MSDFTIHPHALVDPEAKIGPGTVVWNFAQVAKGAIVGANCKIAAGCVIYPGAVLGNGVKLESNTHVFPGVTLEDDVFVGPDAVFTNDLTPRAGEPKHGEWLTTLVKRGAAIGANATIVCGHTIGHYAAIAAGAVVTQDVPPHALVAGNPAVMKRWICRCNHWGALRFTWEGATCRHCGRKYQLVGAPGAPYPHEAL